MFYLLLLSIFLLYFLNLGLPQVWMPNESFYAEASRRMLESFDFLTPYYNGQLRLAKPPMTYWIVSLGYTIFGVNELGLRFFHAMLGLLIGLLTFLLSKEVLKDTKVSLFSMLILLASFQFFANTRYASPEVPFTFFITLSLYLWLLGYKRGNTFLIFLAFLSSSLAMLVKGPAGFFIPASVVFLYLLFSDPKELLKKRYYFFTFIALPLGLWWHVYQLILHRKEFLDVFYSENLKRIYAGNDPFYFYPLDTLVSFLPYSFLVFFALFWTFFKKRREYSFFLVWFLFLFVFFSLVRSKIPVYVLPAYPAMAIITAGFLKDSEWHRIIKVSTLILTLLISLILIILMFYLELDSLYLLLFFFPIFFLLKERKLAPLAGAIAFIFLMDTGVLTYLEDFRKYRELGNFVASLDPENRLKTYQVGYFHHNLPFYAKRRIIRDEKPERNSIVLFEIGSFDGCNPLKTWRLYTSSESRFVTYLLDTKRNKRFKDFGVCIYR